MDKEYIKAKLKNLPNEPGSYQMKDKNGEIIYVGKAKNLHNRVNQYFVGTGRPSGLRKTTRPSNSLAHRTTWLRSDLKLWY